MTNTMKAEEIFENMEGFSFHIFEEEGKVVVGVKNNPDCGVIDFVTLPRIGEKKGAELYCAFKGGIEKKMWKNISFFLEDTFWCSNRKYSSEVLSITDELLKNRQVLSETELGQHLIPAVEGLQELDEDVFWNLSYWLTPMGQKDLVFRDTVSCWGLKKGVSSKDLLSKLEEEEVSPRWGGKTPWGEVGLTKEAYQVFKDLVNESLTVRVRDLFFALVPEQEIPKMTAKGWLSATEKFFKSFSSEELNLLKTIADKNCYYFDYKKILRSSNRRIGDYLDLRKEAFFEKIKGLVKEGKLLDLREVNMSLDPGDEYCW